MPRRPRGELRGAIHHVINRGNNRSTVFHEDADFRIFVELLSSTKARISIRLYAFVLMSNHFHLIAEPSDIDTLSRYMHRVLQRYALQHHRRNGTTGHLWQGRYKSFPIESDTHYLTVVQYVLRNPVRAGIVERAHDYPWTSLHCPELIDESPLPLPTDREHWLSEEENPEALGALRSAANRQFPFGTPQWTAETAHQLGIAARRAEKWGQVQFPRRK